MLFLRVSQPSGEIVGWQRTYADVPPDPPAGLTHEVIPVDEFEVPVDPLVVACMAELSWPQSGPLRWRWDGIQPVEIPDPRFPVRVTQTPNPGLIRQTLTVKLEVLNAAGNVRTGVNTTATVQLLDQNGRSRRVRVNIVAGVAERTFTPNESGELELLSDADQVVFQGDNPVVIDEAW